MEQYCGTTILFYQRNCQAVINGDYVHQQLSVLVEDEDLSRYIL